MPNEAKKPGRGFESSGNQPNSKLMVIWVEGSDRGKANQRLAPMTGWAAGIFWQCRCITPGPSEASGRFYPSELCLFCPYAEKLCGSSTISVRTPVDPDEENSIGPMRTSYTDHHPQCLTI